MNLFRKHNNTENNNWTNDHIRQWNDYLVKSNNGLTLFQIKLIDKLKNVFNVKSILFDTEMKDYQDDMDKSKDWKMVVLTLKNDFDSKLWIYHDMADFRLNNKSSIFEKWGYKEPNDLIQEFTKSVEKEINN